MTDTIIPAKPDPRDLKIVSDNRHDDSTLALLAPGNNFTRRATAGLLTDLAPHVVGRLSAVDRDGHEVPMESELVELRKARAKA